MKRSSLHLVIYLEYVVERSPRLEFVLADTTTDWFSPVFQETLMLHHFSIAVQNPQHVADVFAEILQGQAIPFPPNPGSFMTLAVDEVGTGIEFYPMGTELVPDAWEGHVGFQINAQTTQYSSFHAAISVPISREEIERIGDREGWRVCFANRDDLFDVLELWVENRLMIELLTPAMTQKYLNALNPQRLQESAKQFATAAARR
ncbi:MAG: hypothetical protein SFY66_26760 [Oculatellaceae cyanobacterium bins.114]|nr:hypothetical protein [Oculatellaceae cyanobacterium bins.114]